MSAQEIEAVAQQIISAAALAEGLGEVEAAGESDALEAALAVETALREVSGGSNPTVAPAEAEAGSDEAWFAANPGRTARLRPHQPGEPRPWWAAEGEALMSAVRCMHRLDKPFAEVLPAEAFAGEPVGDSDASVMAAVRAAKGLHY